ncbi:MAG: peptidase [Flavobacteriales bacterium CG18_big_fil_WC_8_21_14_2_50_32_9]|nr:MAG: peptidase [Flavobacteriales bacterium CG18_big_fil_WC_8_21_14_2_50_32_9]
MPAFSVKSKSRLATASSNLQRLFNVVIMEFDCTVLEGKRSETKQRENVARGVSKTLQSKHVYPLDAPSLAVDVAPYPLQWPDREVQKKALAGDAAAMNLYTKQVAMFYAFGGYVKGVADRMGIKIRWGGDWDGDWVFVDQTFDDLVHFEELEA